MRVFQTFINCGGGKDINFSELSMTVKGVHLKQSYVTVQL